MNNDRYDPFVAADVLYAAMDGLFLSELFGISFTIENDEIDGDHNLQLQLSPVHWDLIRHSIISLVL